MAIKHAYVATTDDPANQDLIGASKWNADLAIEAGTIVDADVSALAGLAVAKLADGSAYQTLRTNAAGNAVEWGYKIAVGTTAPASPSVGDIWIDTNA